MRELSFFARKNFSQLENFDSYNKGSGWVAYCDSNDWKNATTGIAIILEKPYQKSRIWFHVQFPKDIIKDVDSSSATLFGAKERSPRIYSRVDTIKEEFSKKEELWNTY